MIHCTKLIAFVLFVLSAQTSNAQDIISKDGHNMGPRGIFIDVCAGDSLVELNPYQGYSSITFCNCTAENLLPLLTQEEIYYYMAGGRQEELMNKPEYAQIIKECMTLAQQNWKQPPPPPQEEIKEVTRSLNDTIIIYDILEMVDYEAKFYEILDSQLLELAGKADIKKKKLESIREKIGYEVINQPVIINTYKEYSSEDLLSIYEYFEPMTSKELTNTGVRYEQHILDYFISKIRILIGEALDTE